MRKNKLIIVVVAVIIALGIIATLSIKLQANDSLKTGEPESYISCGCGCCGFDEPLEKIARKECIYKSKGESILDKINEDKQLSPEVCATSGCSLPIKYVYCD